MAATTGAKPPTPAKPSSAGGKVTVASKLPMGIHLQLSEFADVRLPDGRGGYFTDKVARKVGTSVRVNGTAYPRGEPPEGFRERPRMLLGFALTEGVDEEFWETWKEQNKGFPPLESGLLYAFKKPEDGRSEARDNADVTSGLDPLSAPKSGPIKDPRMVHGLKGIVMEGQVGPTDLDTAA